MNTKVMFSSNSNDWGTPQHLFNVLNAEFNFNLDVCAEKYNAKCENFFSPEDNSLNQKWTGTCFMNPPYGRGIIDWVKKALHEAKKKQSNSGVFSPVKDRNKVDAGYLL